MGNTVSKNAKGFGYSYTDIAEIHNWLEANGLYYYQYIERIEGDDYIYTVPIIGGEEQPPRRGCRIVTAPLNNKSNPAQEQGAAITYARRYSLLMAFGLATADDDAESLTQKIEDQKINSVKVRGLISKCKSDGVDVEMITKRYKVKELADLTEKQFSEICSVWTKEFVNGDKGKN
jgi:hypothetical protein